MACRSGLDSAHHLSTFADSRQGTGAAQGDVTLPAVIQAEIAYSFAR
jgi:hypothetical protein